MLLKLRDQFILGLNDLLAVRLLSPNLLVEITGDVLRQQVHPLLLDTLVGLRASDGLSLKTSESVSLRPLFI